MHQLTFLYRQDIYFQESVTNHQFTYQCIPKREPRQEILDLHVNVFPCDFWAFGQDGFLNRTIYGRRSREHERFYLEVSGTIQTDWQMYDTDDRYNPLLLMQTSLTVPGITMKDGLEKEMSFLQKEKRAYEKARLVMDWMYDHFVYEKGITGVNTTAEQAFASGKGVCQDYAHAMIGICRYLGIPARYVSGAIIGEGFSHAWVEIYSEGKWFGFDPTNHLLVDDYYITFARGRDSRDCILNKGTFFGRCAETQEIKVIVEVIK